MMAAPSPNLQKDVATIQSIEAVPSILEVVRHATGMGFVAVARVTEGRWIACSVLDRIGFGLKPGDELKVETTICFRPSSRANAMRSSRFSLISLNW